MFCVALSFLMPVMDIILRQIIDISTDEVWEERGFEQQPYDVLDALRCVL